MWWCWEWPRRKKICLYSFRSTIRHHVEIGTSALLKPAATRRLDQGHHCRVQIPNIADRVSVFTSRCRCSSSPTTTTPSRCRSCPTSSLSSCCCCCCCCPRHTDKPLEVPSPTFSASKPCKPPPCGSRISVSFRSGEREREREKAMLVIVHAHMSAQLRDP